MSEESKLLSEYDNESIMRFWTACKRVEKYRTSKEKIPDYQEKVLAELIKRKIDFKD